MALACRLSRPALPSIEERSDMRDLGVPNVYLKAGEFFMSPEPARVVTVLGSCISVTMFNPRLGIGAICHCLLPRNDGRGDDFKYVDTSIMRMIGAFEMLGTGRREIEVKLFGGADMFRSGATRLRMASIGEQNVKTALDVLQEQGLSLLAADTGGLSGRKLYYYIHTNRAYVRRLRRGGWSGHE